MVVSDSEGQGVAHERLEGQLIAGPRISQDSEVEPPVAQSLDLGVVEQLVQAELQVGICLPGFANEGGYESHVRRRQEAESQLASFAASHTASQLARALDFLESMRRLVEEGAAGLSEANASLRASEQIGPQRPLELADGTAERRLADVQPFGRPTEMQLVGDGDEVVQQAYVGSNSYQLSVGRE